jgi:hypothetical protein
MHESWSRPFKRLVALGCDADDLEWALFWVVLHEEKRVDSPPRRRRFQDELDGILRDIQQLKKRLDGLFGLPLGVSTVLSAELAALGVGAQEEARVRSGPLMLLLLQDTLRQFQRPGISFEHLHSSSVSEAEALLLVYVHKFSSRKSSVKEVSVLMEAACEACEIEGREYSEEAVAKRYRRFKKASPDQFAQIVSIVDEFADLKQSGKDVNLIPFFCNSYVSWARRLLIE